jgi:hypothetical protein
MNTSIQHRISSTPGKKALCINLLLSLCAAGSAQATVLEPCRSALDVSPHIPTATVIRSTGAIQADVDWFRALLGGPNNGATLGQQPAGRREINWDGVPAALTNVPTFPNDFFNVNSPRGLIYEPTGPGLEVSDQSFVNLGPQYAGEFIPFSGTKLFSPVGTNDVVVRFAVAGSDTKASVRGIGVVFSDVDKPNKTAIELLGVNGEILGHFTAPTRSDRRGLSFLGIVFRNPVIRTVHVIAGDGNLGNGSVDVSQGGLHDLVVMDDFIYGEPNAIE